MDLAAQLSLPLSDILVLALGGMIAGIFILIKSGNWAIDGSVSLANHLNISPLIIGFTIVAFGTSLPELVVSINANMKGFPGLSVGNVVGSNIANILLVIGMTACLMPIAFKLTRRSLEDMIMLILSSILLVVLVQFDVISRVMGMGMVAILVLYVIWQYIQAKKGEITIDDEETGLVYEKRWQAYLFSGLGLVGIALGAEILVRSAVIGASSMGVSEAVIGLTIVALGTSLPELVTCIIAAKRGQAGIVLGNIVGSGVFNILSIIGITAIISPIYMTKVSDKVMNFDIWLMLVITLIFAGLLMKLNKFGRAIGLVFLIGYIAFTAEQYLSMM